SEIVAAALLLAGMLALQRRHALIATAALTAAVLARETMAVFVFGLALSILWARLRGRPTLPVATVLVPAATAAVWQIVLYLRWGQFAFQGGSANFGPPLTGFAEFARSAASLTGSLDGFLLLQVIFGIGMTVGVLYAMRNSIAPGPILCAWAIAT